MCALGRRQLFSYCRDVAVLAEFLGYFMPFEFMLAATAKTQDQIPQQQVDGIHVVPAKPSHVTAWCPTFEALGARPARTPRTLRWPLRPAARGPSATSTPLLEQGVERWINRGVLRGCSSPFCER